MDAKNVMIPIALMNHILDLLFYWDLSSYDESIKADHEYVTMFLLEKRTKLNLRETYSRMVNAKSEEERHLARMGYLQLRLSL